MHGVKLSREVKQELMRRVQRYFEEERGEQLGELGADQLVEFVLEELGPAIYNHALADARALVLEKAAQIEDELYSLEQHYRPSR